MSLSDQKSFVIHSKNIQTKRPVSIGILRSTVQTLGPLNNHFELRPTTQQQKEKDYQCLTTTRQPRQRSQKNPTKELNVVKESKMYPMIHFCQKTFRQMLKEVEFESNIKSLQSKDPRNMHLYQVTSELFEEINFSIINLLICQHRITLVYYIYFADCDLVPISKCCNIPIMIKVSLQNHGQIICNSLNCYLKTMSTFFLQYRDMAILWDDPKSVKQEKLLKRRISNSVTTGRYRSQSLSRQVNRTHHIAQPQNKFYDSLQNQDIFLEDEGISKRNSRTPIQYNSALVDDLVINGKLFLKNFKLPLTKYDPTLDNSIQNLEKTVSIILQKQNYVKSRPSFIFTK